MIKLDGTLALLVLRCRSVVTSLDESDKIKASDVLMLEKLAQKLHERLDTPYGVLPVLLCDDRLDAKKVGGA